MIAAVMVAAIIPAFNEAERIAATVRAAESVVGKNRVWVVDDGSTDDTATCARNAGAYLVRLSQNGGKARALTEGVRAVLAWANANPTREPGEPPALFLFLDADLKETAAFAAALIAPVAAGEADMSIATFPVKPGVGGGFGGVVRLARWGVEAATGRTMFAPLSGQRCLSLSAWEAAQPLSPGFGVEVALTIDVLRAGFRVVEVPTEMDHRVTGRSLAARLHRARQGRDVFRALVPRLLARAKQTRL